MERDSEEKETHKEQILCRKREREREKGKEQERATEREREKNTHSQTHKDTHSHSPGALKGGGSSQALPTHIPHNLPRPSPFRCTPQIPDLQKCLSFFSPFFEKGSLFRPLTCRRRGTVMCPAGGSSCLCCKWPREPRRFSLNP